MREILFRGYSPTHRSWCVGDLIYSPTIDKPCISNSDVFLNVAKWSVSQYTGLNDKDGKRIFEGDVVRLYGGTLVCEVRYGSGAFYLVRYSEEERERFYGWLYEVGGSVNIEVIGNVYDTPKARKEEDT